MADNDFKDAEAVYEESGPLGPSKNERSWATGCHVAALCGYLLPIVLAQFLAPLCVWLIKRNEGAFVDAHGKEALNFQLSLLLYAGICFLLLFLVVGRLLLLPLLIFGFVCPIIAAVRASDGREFRYPMCIRFIK